MSIIGKSLVHYEITAEIGKGGMGEVYQAKDTKLGRDVAIKVLPEEFAMDHDRVARFQREAKLLASLNHPNIAAIYGLEESDGTHFLVMELIEGDTLRDRIKSGPIPVEEALKLALQMTEALEAAHENGVIHRDLKPANIKITPDGKVKILDFGLAKAYVGDQENLSPMDSPTISAAATQQGVILGTAAYMSPEQARGKPVDKRADIWAFGVVLYEMLTGKAAFSGTDVTDTLASVVKLDANMEMLPANLHPRVHELLSRCLQKDTRRRYSGIGDARYEIEQTLSDPSGIFAQPISTVEPRRKKRSTIALIAAAVILIAVIVGIVVWYLKPAPPPEPKRVMRSYYELPEDQQLLRAIDGSFQLAVSPDGSQFAYSTTKGIYIRSMSELDARLISGTDEDASSLFFSHDGQWISYFSAADHKLKSISVSGGAPTVLCDAMLVLGAFWYEDNTIVYSDLLSGVCRIPAKGGTPEVLVERPMVAAGQLLPDGKSVMFIDINSQPFKTMVQSLDTGDLKVVFESGGGSYLNTGHYIYEAEGNLFAVPFDTDKLEFAGGAVSVMEAPIGIGLSKSGTLIYVPAMTDTGGSVATPKRTLVWVDRNGKETPTEAPPHDYGYPKISPDGTKIALSTEINNNMDIWIWDLLRKTLTRLTFDPGMELQPIWTLDGEKILFSTFLGDRDGIYWKAANGTGEEEKLFSEPNRLLLSFSWSGDGKNLVLSSSKLGVEFNISIASMDGENPIKPLLQTEPNETHPQVSPDGRWLAYCSDESGTVEVYVRPFPDVNAGRWQVSTSGGNSPRWSPDGQELYYLVGETQTEAIMAVPVETEPTFKPGTPLTLFRGRYLGAFPSNGIPWDIHPDGDRFLMMKGPVEMEEESAPEEPSELGPRKIIIVQNWIEELKQRVPVD